MGASPAPGSPSSGAAGGEAIPGCIDYKAELYSTTRQIKDLVVKRRVALAAELAQVCAGMRAEGLNPDIVETLCERTLGKKKPLQAASADASLWWLVADDSRR